MVFKSRLLTGHALIQRARELGVVVYADNANVPLGTNPLLAPIAPEGEIQNRVIQAERHLRERWLWVIAVVSGIASVISAIAAWSAIYLRVAEKIS